MRNYRGFDFNSGYPVTELTLDNIQTIFQSNFLKQIERVNFNGNLGDFGLARDAIEIVEYILQNSSARIQIETNGSMRSPEWWAKLVNPRVTILWALDGLADTHSLYRQDTDWNKVVVNAQAFIRAGGLAVWKFIPFDHNQHQQTECRELSQQLGFKNFIVYNQGRNQGPVFTRKGEFSHWLGKPESNKPDLNYMIEDHITWFKPGTKISWIDESSVIDCKHKKSGEIYLAADGSIYPCCWLGFFPETMQHPGNSQLAPLITNNNAIKHDLSECLEWFDNVEKTWAEESMAQGRLYTCINSCSVKKFIE
jgi:sulfatase maturation enzyme AslB (radical SAM superfamily)